MSRLRLSLPTLHVSLVLFLLPAFAAAQTFPTKPIRIIATATAAGGVDTSSRIVAQSMQETEIKKWARVVQAAKIVAE